MTHETVRNRTSNSVNSHERCGNDGDLYGGARMAGC